MDKLIQFLAQSPFVLGDGAIGTMLQDRNHRPPEEWNITSPGIITSVHRGYLDAGARILGTNSFGGNGIRLARYSLEGRTAEINHTAAELAFQVAHSALNHVLVAGSMGPTGEYLEPVGDLPQDKAFGAFFEQALALASGGVNFFLVETASNLAEVSLIIDAIKSAAPELPIAVTMTFDENGFTSSGVTPEQAVSGLHNLGVRVLGANCGKGPVEMESVIRRMAKVVPKDVFLVAQSNAGLPDPKTGFYSATPEVMARYALRMRELGVRWIGACCGSTPAHIQAMNEALKG